MRDRLKFLLRDKRGSSTYIDLSVLILVCMMILSVSVSFLQVYAKHNLVNTMAHEIARYIEIKGEVNSNTYTEFGRLKLASGFADAQVSIDKSGRIQLEDSFTVTVTVPQKFGIGSIQIIPVTIKAVATGRSEVYWK